MCVSLCGWGNNYGTYKHKNYPTNISSPIIKCLSPFISVCFKINGEKSDKPIYFLYCMHKLTSHTYCICTDYTSYHYVEIAHALFYHIMHGSHNVIIILPHVWAIRCRALSKINYFAVNLNMMEDVMITLTCILPEALLCYINVMHMMQCKKFHIWQ